MPTINEIAELNWLWLITVGFLGLISTAMGIKYLQASHREKPDESSWSPKEWFVKKTAEWNKFPPSKEETGFRLLLSGITISLTVLFLALVKLSAY